ncbi:MAG: phosphoenolpyruvate--protein phosphotransferase, partial [Clostridiales bacterium]|nr:phosphoenolpyruvate--protein phosphotransferase [Clostridiales bacterium]
MKTINVDKMASKGLAMGKAFVVNKDKLVPDTYAITNDNVALEIDKFENAVETAVTQLEVLAKDNEIFAAHLEMARDPFLYDGVTDKIKSQKRNVQLALEDTINELTAIFESMDDAYMKERSADVKDIGYRLMCILKGVSTGGFEQINEEVILVAEDLSPSDTSSINLDYVLGFVTELGGVTSHVS